MKKRILLALFLPYFLAGCQVQEKVINESSARESESRTETFTLEKQTLSPTVKLTGHIQAEKDIPLTSKIRGRVEVVNVDIGDQVKKGQLLVDFSEVNDETQTAFINATQNLESAKLAAENAVFQAQVGVETADRALTQRRREQEENYEQIFEVLKAKAQNSETLISTVLDFLNSKLGATTMYRHQVNYTDQEIGNNNTLLKQDVKNETEQLFRAFDTWPDTIDRLPLNDQQILIFARERHLFLSDLKKILSDFNTLTRESVVSSRFSESYKKQIQSQSENLLTQVNQTLLDLESQIKSAEAGREQIEMAIVGAENQVDAARSQLELAQAQSENQVTGAQSQYRLAATSKAEMKITAPFSGVIVQKMVEPGQLVNPGVPLFRLADSSVYKIVTDIADTYLGSIDLGTKAKIRLDGLEGQVYTGSVTKIYPSVDIQTRKVGIELTLDTPETEEAQIAYEAIKMGLFARITLQLPDREVFLVPERFIFSSAEGPWVESQSAGKIMITQGEKSGGLVEIKASELEAGMMLELEL